MVQILQPTRFFIKIFRHLLFSIRGEKQFLARRQPSQPRGWSFVPQTTNFKVKNGRGIRGMGGRVRPASEAVFILFPLMGRGDLGGKLPPKNQNLPPLPRPPSYSGTSDSSGGIPEGPMGTPGLIFIKLFNKTLAKKGPLGPG